MKSILFVLFFGIAINSYAQDFDESKEKTEIENNIKILVEAWTKGDANLFASPFTEDADFMVWFGLHLTGKKEIAAGHDFIFKDFYADTVWDLKLKKIRFISNEVALVHCAGAVIKVGDSKPNEPDAVPLMVFHKVGNQWKIVALQNTIYAVEEFNGKGSIGKIKKFVKENMDK